MYVCVCGALGRCYTRHCQTREEDDDDDGEGERSARKGVSMNLSGYAVDFFTGRSVDSFTLRIAVVIY